MSKDFGQCAADAFNELGIRQDSFADDDELADFLEGLSERFEGLDAQRHDITAQMHDEALNAFKSILTESADQVEYFQKKRMFDIVDQRFKIDIASEEILQGATSFKEVRKNWDNFFSAHGSSMIFQKSARETEFMNTFFNSLVSANKEVAKEAVKFFQYISPRFWQKKNDELYGKIANALHRLAYAKQSERGTGDVIADLFPNMLERKGMVRLFRAIEAGNKRVFYRGTRSGMFLSYHPNFLWQRSQRGHQGFL